MKTKEGGERKKKKKNTTTTHINPNHIPRHHPPPHEIHRNTTPTRAAKALHLSMRSKRVTPHFVPAAEPFDLVATGKDEQEAVAPADAAVALLDGDVPSGLPRQGFVLEAEADRAAVAGSGEGDLGNRGVGSVPAPDDGLGRG